jgi:RHS repeat-associated protein
MTTDIRYTLDKKSRLKTPQTLSLSSPAGLTARLDLDKTYVEDADGLTHKATATLSRNGKTTTSITDYQTGTATSTSPSGRKATSTFDPTTLLVGTVEFGGLLPTHFGYDSHGRLSAATTGTRNVAYGYDGRGNLASVVDPLGRTTNYSYDLLDRPTRTDRPDNSTVRFEYDASGNLTVLTTPVPADNHFAYNGVNRVSGFTTPLGSATSYAYDKERKLTEIKLPSGKTLTNTYTHGRLTGTTTAEWTNSYSYSCGELPASISRGGELLNYTYDGTLLKSIAQSGSVLGNITFTYNNDFNPTAVSYGGATASFGYDNDGLLTAAGRFTIARNAANGLPEQVSADGFQLNRSFNGHGEVEAAGASLGSSGFSYDLTRNDSGRITAKSEQIEGATSQFAYSYDTVGRLLTVTRDGQLVEEYRYDANGNRTYETNTHRGISGRTFTHSDEDHTLTAGPIGYEFDYDDNLAARREGTETTQYSYSSTGELQQVTLPDSTLIEYINDPLGRRIAKKVNGAIEEKYLWLDQTTLLAVYDGAGNLRQRFEYADDRVPYAMTQGGTTYYLAYDQVGSLRLITDSAGNNVKRVDYDSFGNIISDSNPTFAIPFGFAGGLNDPDTKLVRFGYRDYMPEIGKWTAKDPILFVGGDSNLYGYVQNDPVNWVDPWGLRLSPGQNLGVTVASSAAAMIGSAIGTPVAGAAAGALVGAVASAALYP